jgi:hypothetical protein
MAEATTIKEFLVALGYKTDETAAKKFIGGIEIATKAVVALGAAVEAAAFAVAVGAARWASSLEALYFASQRTGSSADQLQAFAMASRNFGSSIDEAMGSAEALATFFRQNPGGENFVSGFLRQIGIDSRNLHGEVDWLKALGKLFTFQRANNQVYLSELLSQKLGISEHQMLAMSTPGFAEELDRQERNSKGWIAAAKAAHEFEIVLQNIIRQVQQQLLPILGPLLAGESGLIGKFSKFLRDHGKQLVNDINYVATRLLNFLGSVLDWFDKHGDALQKNIEDTFGAVKKAYDMIRPALEWMWDEFNKLDAATGGWLKTLALLAIALKAIGAGGIISGIASLGAALAKSLGVAAAASEGVGAWAVLGTAWGAAAAVALGAGLGYLLDKLWPDNPLAGAGDYLSNFFADALDKDKAQRWAWRHPGTTPPAAGAYTGNYPWLTPTPAEGGGKNITVNMDTDINVSEAQSEIMGNQNLARLIAQEQARVSADLIREFASDNR